MFRRHLLTTALGVWTGLLLLAGCSTPQPPNPPTMSTNVVIELTPIEYAPERRVP